MPIPIYLYNFPAMSGVPYHIGLVKKLLDQYGARIGGLKDSSNDLEYCRAANQLSDAFHVFPSNEASLLETAGSPFAGCISATAKVNSDLCATAYGQKDEGRLRQAVDIRKSFDGLPLVAAIKHLVSLQTGNSCWRAMKPPLASLAFAQQTILLKRLKETSYSFVHKMEFNEPV